MSNRKGQNPSWLLCTEVLNHLLLIWAYLACARCLWYCRIKQ